MGKYRKSLFIVFVISLFLLVDNVSAESIQNTCYSINQDCSTKSRFMYSLYGTTDDFYTGAFGSRYSGKADYLVFDFDYDLLGNSTYLLTITASDIDFRNISKSNSYLATSTSCGDATGTELEITNVSYTQSKVVITFKTVSNASRFILIFGEDGASKYITAVNTFGFSSVDITTVESNDTQNIIDNANQNSQAIIDNNKENTESIIGNNDKNTQDIIDNQNKNNEELKDTINDSLNSCRPSVNLFNKNDGSIFLNAYVNGDNKNLISLSNAKSFYIPIIPNTTYTISRIPGKRFVVGTFTSNSIGSIATNIVQNSTGSGITITSGSNDKFLIVFYYLSSADTLTESEILNSIQVEKGNIATDYEPYGKEICQSKIDETNDKIDNLTGAITDSSSPDTSVLADAAGWLPAGPIDSLLTLPITLLQTLTNNLGSSCSPINLPLPFVETNLTLACPSVLLGNINGFTIFWNSVGVIAGGWLLYKYFINLYKWFNSVTSMKEDEQDEDWGGV